MQQKLTLALAELCIMMEMTKFGLDATQRIAKQSGSILHP